MATILVIDSGHGGPDTGAVSPFGEEKFLNWDLATRVLNEAKAAGLTAFLIPHTPATTEGNGRLAARVAFGVSKKADVFLCIHWNATSPPSVRGTECWYQEGDEKSVPLAQAVGNAVAHQLNTVRRPDHPDNEDRLGRLGVLHGHLPKTVHFLLETAFVTNAQDVESYKQAPEHLAKAIVAVIAGYRPS